MKSLRALLSTGLLNKLNGEMVGLMWDVNLYDNMTQKSM